MLHDNDLVPYVGHIRRHGRTNVNMLIANDNSEVLVGKWHNFVQFSKLQLFVAPAVCGQTMISVWQLLLIFRKIVTVLGSHTPQMNIPYHTIPSTNITSESHNNHNACPVYQSLHSVKVLVAVSTYLQRQKSSSLWHNDVRKKRSTCLRNRQRVAGDQARGRYCAFTISLPPTAIGSTYKCESTERP